MCAEDERAALSNAWHDAARVGVLRAAIVGGLPLDITTTSHPDSTLSVGHEGSPRCSVSCAQRVAGVATQPA